MLGAGKCVWWESLDQLDHPEIWRKHTAFPETRGLAVKHRDKMIYVYIIDACVFWIYVVYGVCVLSTYHIHVYRALFLKSATRQLACLASCQGASRCIYCNRITHSKNSSIDCNPCFGSDIFLVSTQAGRESEGAQRLKKCGGSYRKQRLANNSV